MWIGCLVVMNYHILKKFIYFLIYRVCLNSLWEYDDKQNYLYHITYYYLDLFIFLKATQYYILNLYLGIFQEFAIKISTKNYILRVISPKKKGTCQT